MRCETCNAVITDTNVILSRGTQSHVKHYNRVCKHALKRDKPCANKCRIPDPSLTWEAEFEKLDLEVLKLTEYLKLEY
jgi:hypothetical protein